MRDATEDGRAAADITGVELAADTAQMASVEQVADALLADLEDPVTREEDGARRADVTVARVERCPACRCPRGLR